MTPVGDIELELVFRVAVRGKTSDLAKLLRALNDAQVVVLCLAEEGTAQEEQDAKGRVIKTENVQP